MRRYAQHGTSRDMSPRLRSFGRFRKRQMKRPLPLTLGDIFFIPGIKAGEKNHGTVIRRECLFARRSVQTRTEHVRMHHTVMNHGRITVTTKKKNRSSILCILEGWQEPMRSAVIPDVRIGLNFIPKSPLVKIPGHRQLFLSSIQPLSNIETNQTTASLHYLSSPTTHSHNLYLNHTISKWASLTVRLSSSLPTRARLPTNDGNPGNSSNGIFHRGDLVFR